MGGQNFEGEIMMINGIHVVEWSPSQQCFHVELSSEMSACNMRVFSSQTVTDYLTLGLFDSYEKASEFIESVRQCA